jgi:hypothetical protein
LLVIYLLDLPLLVFILLQIGELRVYNIYKPISLNLLQVYTLVGDSP